MSGAQTQDSTAKTPAGVAADVLTFGCRLNAYESEIMRSNAASAGITDAVFVNTCAVTAEAARQARQAIRRARRNAPHKTIIVTGCAAQIDPESFAAMPEVDHVIGNAEKLDPAAYTGLSTDALPRVQVNSIFSVTETAGHLVQSFGGRARAFVQIQNGCNHRCTFCIIPYGRGNSRSVAAGEVVRQIQTLVDEGYAEVVLTGVDLTSYGEDLPGTPSLGQLVQKILKLVPGLSRLRLSSIDSIEVDQPLLDAIANEDRLMPHLHLSLQAGDNMILKRMKRRHSREDAIDFVRRVKALRPETVFGADIITGFPTEDEAMFGRSLDMLDACDLSLLHVFPYSAREGTPAARMPQVPVAVRKERAARLRAAGEAKLQTLMQRRSGGQASVLVEKLDANGFGIGHSEDFLPVHLADPAAVGEIVQARLSLRGDILSGQRLSAV